MRCSRSRPRWPSPPLARMELRDPEKRYHIYTVADFQKLAPDFDFSRLLQGRERGPFRHAERRHARLLQGPERLIATEPVDAWKSYFRWHTIHSSAPDLPKAFRDENFDFLRQDAGRPEGADAALEAVHGDDRSRAGRSGGPGLGEGALPARGQGQHGPACGGARKSRWATTSRRCPG